MTLARDARAHSSFFLVVPPPPNVRRHFLPWNCPLLPQAVEFLAGDWVGEGPLDLSDLLVIVPTRQSGRRLREALAGHAAAKNSAVFPPRVLLPDSLVATTAEEPEVAPRLDAQLAWTEVFRTVDLEAFRAVFPVDPPVRNFPWAMRLAQEFSKLQRALVETGLRFADVERLAGEDFPETERWRQLAQLERLQAQALATRGLREPHAARIAADGGAAFAGVRRVVMLGTPDPLPLALGVIARAAATREFDLVIFAPAGEAAAFDEWGRPRAAAWSGRVLELPDFEESVQLCANPAAQAERAAEVARRYGEPEGLLGVGVADPEILPLLENALRQAGLAAFNPEGRRRAGDGLYQLLLALATLVNDDAFAKVEALARCPDFLEFLRTRLGRNFSAARFLDELDRLHTRHLPPTLAEAREHVRPDGDALGALAVIAELRAMLRRGAFPENAAAALAEIFAARRFDLTREGDALAAESAEAWTEVLRETTEAARRFPGLAPAEWWEIARRLYGESVRYDDKAPGAVELQGWLELLWEDAPHLIVAGLNDGSVPDAVVGDPFLPESLRERLGLKTNAARFARDAYLLQALAMSRSGGGGGEQTSRPHSAGRVDILLGKASVAGDPLRPSRLLLRCADGELPERIRFLFRAADGARATPGWRRAWQLTPRAAPPPARVAVTGLRAWLACPFRFYLSYVLRMKGIEPGKTELDVFDFGHLCHAALEAMGRAETLRDCVDARRLREFLLGELDAAARNQFGAVLTLPLIVQLESARQRLSRAAEIQAETRAAGWVIERVEHPFEIEIAGLTVTGKIDRIDRHEKTGAWRVLDYKTSDKPVEPWQAHHRGVRRDEAPPEFAVFEVGGKRRVWADLQLPLYRRAVGAGPAEVSCAYFNLPKAAGETGIREWEDFSPELDAAAWRCAEGVTAAIRAGEFWPPSEDIAAEWDEFAALFHHGAADSVVRPGAGVSGVAGVGGTA